MFNPAIKTELRLSDDQKDKLNEFASPTSTQQRRGASQLKEIPRADPEKRKASSERRQKMMKEFDDTAMSILTAEQLDQFQKMRGKPTTLVAKGRPATSELEVIRQYVHSLTVSTSAA